MKTLLSLITVILAHSASASGPLRVYDPTKKSYVVIDLIMHDGVNITASCKKPKGFDCQAIKPKLIKDPKLSKVPLLGNPGSTYCTQVGGKSRILLDAKNAEYDFCLFKDGSMADSWQLYNKRANR